MECDLGLSTYPTTTPVLRSVRVRRHSTMVVFFAIHRRLCEVFQHLWNRKGLYGVVRRRSRAEPGPAAQARPSGPVRLQDSVYNARVMWLPGAISTGKLLCSSDA